MQKKLKSKYIARTAELKQNNGLTSLTRQFISNRFCNSLIFFKIPEDGKSVGLLALHLPSTLNWVVIYDSGNLLSFGRDNKLYSPH